MRKSCQPLGVIILSCIYIVLGGSPVLADDIDIFMGNADNQGQKAKVLLIIDNSQSMDHNATCSPGVTCDNSPKIDVVKKVLQRIMIDGNDAYFTNPSNTPSTANSSFQGMQFAVMNFNSNGNGANDSGGGKFIMEFKELNNNTVDDIVTMINNIQTDNYTPLAETLYEAARFYSGMTPDFGTTASSTVLSKVKSGNNYAPDFSGVCGGNNHVVLLTDGKPRNDSDADSDINALYTTTDAQGNTQNRYNFSIPVCDSVSRGGENSNNEALGNCLPLVSEFIYRRDFDGDADVATLVDGTTTKVHNNVITHTIAFDLADATATKLLHQTATGCDTYDADADPYSFISGTANADGVIEDRNCRAYEASNATDLEDAFKKIFTEVNDTPTTFTPPAASIDSTNRLIHDGNVYFAMFKPAEEPRWLGNIKGYQIQNSQLVDFQGTPQEVLDANGDIKATAKSKWSSAADGADPAEGGAESKMPATRSTRNVYTYLGAVDALTSDQNAVDANNDNITLALLEAADAAEKTALIDWAIGSNGRHIIGDPLHSQPAIVNYSTTTTVDGEDTTVVTPYMFFGTNDGFLHAINVSDDATNGGKEAFAFIPKELLKNLKALKANTQTNRIYGVDGEITVGKVNEKVYVYFGMRRGGSMYYALDVTDINAPEFAWQITNESTGFTNLGQTWSKPLLAKVRLQGASGPQDRAALIFGGGYDTQEDAPTFERDPSNNSQTYVGSGIYIVDAETGEKLWSAHGNGSSSASTDELIIAEMDHAIPSSIAGLDLNVDRIVDRLYAIDIAGNLFRIDLNHIAENGNIVPTGAKIADLRDETGNDPTTYRRFYNEPEIVFTRYGANRYLSILTGSGYRANPLEDTIQNRFYSVRDDNVFDIPVTYPSPITETNLYDATDATTTKMSGTSPNDPGIMDKKGWYIDLDDGEKALSSSLTMNNLLMFTTYTPSNTARRQSDDPCEILPPTGVAKFYGIDLLNAKPKAITNSRYVPLERSGIPPSPTVVFTEGDTTNTDNPNPNPDIQIIVGLELLSDQMGMEPVVNKLLWKEQ